MSQIFFFNNIDSTKPVSTFKVAFQPEVFKTEKYTMEISIPQNFRTIKLGESTPPTIQFPDCKKFPSGLLSETPCPYTVKGSFSRTIFGLDIEFLLPDQIKSQTLTMKPFEVGIFAKKTLRKRLSNQYFPPANLSNLQQNNQDVITLCRYYRYCRSVNLMAYWADDVDMIRITWEILIRECGDGFVPASNKNSEMSLSSITNEKIASYYNSEDFSDATLHCGGQVFHVHQFVLSCGSPVFENMFLTDMKEKKNGKIFSYMGGKVVIKEIEPKILEHMIKWIYTKDIQVENNEAFDLYKAAHLYQVQSLKDNISLKLFESISVDNALEMYGFGETYAEIRIFQEALKIIKNNKDKIFENEEILKEFFLKFPKLMMELLKAQ